MPLSNEMVDFYKAWLAKAESYSGEELNDYYNKAFTLFTLYNRLYVEATFTLVREGKITLSDNRPFPDSRGAKQYAPQFVGYYEILQALNSDFYCNKAIKQIINLIENDRFYIKLSMPHGNGQPEKDIKLLSAMRSTGVKTKITAILDLI